MQINNKGQGRSFLFLRRWLESYFRSLSSHTWGEVKWADPPQRLAPNFRDSNLTPNTGTTQREARPGRRAQGMVPCMCKLVCKGKEECYGACGEAGGISELDVFQAKAYGAEGPKDDEGEVQEGRSPS